MLGRKSTASANNAVYKLHGGARAAWPQAAIRPRSFSTPLHLFAVQSGITACDSKLTWNAAKKNTAPQRGGNGSAAINGYVRDAANGYPVDPALPGTQTSYYDAAAVVALTPSADTTATFPDPSSPGILKKYYYTESGSYTATVTPSGAGVKAAKTTFSVAAPTTTLTAKYQYPTRNAVDGVSPTQYLYLNSAPVKVVPIAADKYGVLFTHAPVQSKSFFGQSYFVQIYSANEYWQGRNANVKDFTFKEVGLDGTDPYMATGQSGGDDFAGDGPLIVTDANPGFVSYSPVTVDDSPKMWVMYMPARTGSISIPLASCPWHWGGTLTWNATKKTWSLAGATPSSAGTINADTTDQYPVWTQIVLPPTPTN